MPFVRLQQDEDEKKRKLGLPQAQTAMAGAAAPTPQTSGAPSAGQTSVQGGNFINLQDYLQANQGAGKAMTDAVVGGVDRKAQQVAGSDPTKPATLTVPGAKPMASVNPRNPIPGTVKPLTGQAELDAANEVEGQAALAGTEGGRKQLLDKMYGSGRSKGESDFDNALMGQGSGGRLEQLSQKYKGLAGVVTGNRQYDATQAGLAEDARRLAAGPQNAAIRTGPNAPLIQRNAGIEAATAERRKGLGMDSWNAFNGLDENGNLIPFAGNKNSDWFKFSQGDFDGMTSQERDELDSLLGAAARGEIDWKGPEIAAFSARVKSKQGKQVGTNKQGSEGTPQR